MTGDKRIVDSWSESEFGLGEGVIDPGLRSSRTLPTHQELAEIYAVPKSFGGSMLPGAPLPPEETPVPRLLPGETEADRG